MIELKECKAESKVSWIIPWTAGFLFTVGYCIEPLAEGLVDANFWDFIIAMAGTYVFWPLILGLEVGLQ